MSAGAAEHSSPTFSLLTVASVVTELGGGRGSPGPAIPCSSRVYFSLYRTLCAEGGSFSISSFFEVRPATETSSPKGKERWVARSLDASLLKTEASRSIKKSEYRRASSGSGLIFHRQEASVRRHGHECVSRIHLTDTLEGLPVQLLQLGGLTFTQLVASS